MSCLLLSENFCGSVFCSFLNNRNILFCLKDVATMGNVQSTEGYQKYVKVTGYGIRNFWLWTQWGKCIVGSLCYFTRSFVLVSVAFEMEVFKRSTVTNYKEWNESNCDCCKSMLLLVLLGSNLDNWLTKCVSSLKIVL